MVASRSAQVKLRLNSRLDQNLLATVFARYGRIHIPGVLDRDSALAVHGALNEGIPWQTHYNDGSTVYDIDATAIDSLTLAERAAVLKPIYARASVGFQYIFDNFAVTDHQGKSEYAGLSVMRVLDFLQSLEVMDFARRVTGISGITTVDAQATRYRAGHFLTVHDDRDDNKGRVAAYVLNMTPAWRADWGGILQFLDDDGHVAEGYVPAFNALNIFTVPTRHSVSVVAPFVASTRLSITGWFRR